MSDGLLTEEEVKSYLQADDKEIRELKRRGKLSAFNVGGEFVRYRKDEVVALRNGRKFRMPESLERNGLDAIRDFFRFYGVYLLLAAAVGLLLYYFFHP